MTRNNKKKKDNKNDKISKTDITTQLDIERENAETIEKERTNFIPEFEQWTSLPEQKIKTREMEKMTKNNKK